MKKSTVLFFLIPFITIFGETDLQKEKNIVISRLCEMIHKRSYLLKRLEKIIDLFKRLPQYTKANVIFDDLDSELFLHPRIQKLIILSNEDTSLDVWKDYFNIWEELDSYKYIHDRILITEFTKLTLVIAKKVHLEYSIKSGDRDLPTSSSTVSYTEAVTLRNFYTKRLSKPLEHLFRIHCNQDCSYIFENPITFKHEDINQCFELMTHSNSLIPFFQLATEFNKYYLIQDELFNREFCLLILGLYENIIRHNVQYKASSESTTGLIMHIRDHFDSIPLEHILDAIDLLSQEIPPLVQAAEHNEAKTWRQWIKNNAWILVLLTSLGIRTLLIFKHDAHVDKDLYTNNNSQEDNTQADRRASVDSNYAKKRAKFYPPYGRRKSFVTYKTKI